MGGMQAKVRGLTLEYETFGDSGNPALLLIMGLGQQLLSWPEPFCRQLADAGYYVIRYDNRDVGLSTKCDKGEHGGLVQGFLRYKMRLPVRAPYDLGVMAHDALALATELELERFHLVGVSMGGMIAQIAADIAPDRVSSLVLMMTTSGERKLPSGTPRATALLGQKWPSSSTEAMLDHAVMIKRVLEGSKYKSSEEDIRRSTLEKVKRCFHPEGSVRHTLAVLASPDRKALLARLDVPTLVIHGDEDPLVPLAHGQRVAELVEGARLEVVRGMGHDVAAPAVQPVLAKLILEHVAKV